MAVSLIQEKRVPLPNRKIYIKDPAEWSSGLRTGGAWEVRNDDLIRGESATNDAFPRSVVDFDLTDPLRVNCFF